MQFLNTGNNAWLFQKAYYHRFVWANKNLESYAPAFFNDRLQFLKDTTHIPTDNLIANKKIKLYTIYPGLATGIGVNHESKSKGELSLGFEFDYTQGMPVIRGHSIKGAIRAAFPQDRGKAKFKKEKAYQIHCWINDKEMSVEDFNTFQNNADLYKNIVAIENEIFEGWLNEGLLSNYKQDTFFDAYIVEVSHYETTMNQYLGADSITPHVKKNMSFEASMLKNPIPIPFLKVLPGVAFEFRFSLHDNGLLNEEAKKNLFRKILLENGIGAKTNVGYGQFTVEPPQSSSQKNINRAKESLDENDIIPKEFFRILKKNNNLQGTIVDMNESVVICVFEIEKKEMQLAKKANKIKGNPLVGKKVKLTVNNDYIVGQKLNCKIEVIE